MATQSAQPLSQTAIRKLGVGTTVSLVSAPYVRFRRTGDHTWAEVPRAGVTPRNMSSKDLFILGVQEVHS